MKKDRRTKALLAAALEETARERDHFRRNYERQLARADKLEQDITLENDRHRQTILELEAMTEGRNAARELRINEQERRVHYVTECDKLQQELRHSQKLVERQRAVMNFMIEEF